MEPRGDGGDRRTPWLVAVGLAASALSYDPRALAAEPKTVALLGLACILSALAAAGVLRVAVTLPWALGCVLTVYSLSRGGMAYSAPFAAALGIALCVAALPLAQRRATWLASSVALGAGAAAIAAGQWLGGARGMALHGGLGNPNWLGLLLALTLVPTLHALVHSWRAGGAWRWLWFGLAALQGVAFYLAESRAGWIAMPFGLLAAFVPVRRGFGWLLCLVLVSASVLATYVSLADAGDALGALAGRFWIWKASLAAGIAALPFGTGAAGFSQGFLQQQGAMLATLDISEASRTFVHATTAHNEWLHGFASLGLPGVALLIAMLATAIEGASPAAAGALVALAVSSSADMPLSVPAVGVVVALALVTPERVAVPGASSRSGNMLALCALALCALLLEGSVRQWRATRMATAAQDALPAKRSALLARAAALAPNSARAQFDWGNDQVEQGQPEAGLAALRRSRRLSAAVSTEVAIGNALLELGRVTEARDAFQRALSFNPGSFRAHANLTVVYAELGELTLARAELAKAERLWPGHPKLALIRGSLSRKILDDGSQ